MTNWFTNPWYRIGSIVYLIGSVLVWGGSGSYTLLGPRGDPTTLCAIGHRTLLPWEEGRPQSRCEPRPNESGSVTDEAPA